MLRDQLQADQIAALKSGDKQKLETLRFVMAKIKNKEIETKTPLNDEETLSLLKKQVKELDESIAAFEKGSRTELAAESKAQKEILLPYLPAEISDEELKKAIDELIDKNRQLYEANPKAIIGICMKELKSKADPARIMKMLQTMKP